LKISPPPAVSRDIEYLRKHAQASLQKHIQDKLQEEYQRCLTGINEVLKLSRQIANNNRKNDDDRQNDDGKALRHTDTQMIRQDYMTSLIHDC
jgi:hypothetical protein